MKNILQKTGLTIIGISVLLLLVGCGGETSSNEYLGKLPGIAKEYSEDIDGLKKDLKESTDMAESFSLDKEIDLLEEESDKAIEEYLASNPSTDIPFEQQGDYQFTVKEVSVHPKYSSSASRLQFIAKVTITEDIKKSFGFARDFFAYIKSVDKEGKSLTRRYGVMMNYNNRGPFKANMEVEMAGSLDGPADMVTFEKLVFVSKEEYEKQK
ncbi:MAG: hypothetical protein DRQ01_08405 [Ignavibacteriae bacterium]|nr:MAG: hypothetical protein DRQ01_08405 [Ignavibacteriota bacterium]